MSDPRHLQLFLSRLQKVKKTGQNQWVACCPAHPDNAPSLGIKIGEKEQVVFKCFAGCEQDAIRLAAGLEWSEMYPPQNGLLTGRKPLRPQDRPWAVEAARKSAEALCLLALRAYQIGSMERDQMLEHVQKLSEFFGGLVK